MSVIAGLIAGGLVAFAILKTHGPMWAALSLSAIAYWTGMACWILVDQERRAKGRAGR